MKSSVWPELKKSLSHAKDNITVDQLYLLLTIEATHAGVIDDLFYKKYWLTTTILDAKNFDVFIQLLWQTKRPNAINHPFYVYFMKRIVDSKLLKKFWDEVDKVLATPTKQLEQVSVHAAICALRCIETSPKEVSKILTVNFLQLLNAHSCKSIKDEDLQEMYTELVDLLDKCFQNLKKQEQKLEVLRLFTVTPGRLTIEKGSNKKFISNLINALEIDSLTASIEDIKQIIVSDKDERERQYAASVLQRVISSNKLFSNNIEWRTEQLNFLMHLAFFKSKDGTTLSTNDADVNSNATNIKNIFYHCLEHKLSNLDDEKKFLMGIVTEIDGVLEKKDSNKYLQKPLSENHLKTWKRMMKEVTAKVDKKEKKLRTVFQVLILHMGLQLFNHPDIAENAIAELEVVTKRALAKNSKQDEPDWIEVVVDLFLTLLSQESYVLRNVIRHVFPQLCSQMNLTAFHQILSLLDIKSKENPLQVNGDQESDDEEEIEDEESDNEDEESNDENGAEASENEEDSDIEMDDNEDDDSFEEKETVSDSLKLALQTALGTGVADGDDMDINLDDMDEEEGMKLDIALANAFKILKQNRKQKKTKADKIAEKTLLHFRMRALDLIDIYLKNNPQMEICLETLIFFFDLMPVAVREDKHTPLLPRFDGIFLQLAQLKSFSLETVANVTPKNLAETLTNILDKTVKEKTNIQHLNHFSRAVVFIINCSQMLLKLTPGEDEVLGIIVQKVQEFLTHRNPTLQQTSFIKILSTQWTGNFKLAKFIAETGLKSTIRSLRRTQSLQMLKTFFKNHSLMTQNEKQAKKYPLKVCEHLKEYVNELSEVSESEILELIQFVLALRNHKDFTVKDELVAAVQKFRVHLQLKPNVLSSYKSFCNVMKIPFVGNDGAVAKVNGNGVKHEPKSKAEKPATNGESNGAVKRKKSNTKKEKKMRKRMQLELASKGLDENFSFVNSRSEVLSD